MDWNAWAINVEQIAREGAQKMLQVALQLEIEQCIEQHADRRDEHGKRLVVRNGSLPGRELQTGLGPISVRQPRARRAGSSPVRSSRPTCGGSPPSKTSSPHST